MTAQQLITEAFEELEVGTPGETLSAAEADLGLRKLAMLTDEWNAKREAIYAEQVLSNALTASLQPHTIGPTGTWTTAIRPVSIESATLFLTSGATLPITPRSMAWYLALTSPLETSAQPSDVAYNPSWPNGLLYFWPIPTSALTVKLLVRVLLSEYSLSTTFTLPPGYRKALTLTLAEECAPGLGLQAKPATVLAATKARAIVFNNNVVVPTMTTACAGMLGTGGGFDYLTGRVR